MVQKDIYVTIVFNYICKEFNICRAQKTPSARDTVISTIKDGAQCLDTSDNFMEKHFFVKSHTGSKKISGTTCTTNPSLIEDLIKEVIDQDDFIVVQVLVDDKKLVISEDKLYKRLPAPSRLHIVFEYHYANDKKDERVFEVDIDSKSIFRTIYEEYSFVQKIYSNIKPKFKVVLPLDNESIMVDEIEDIRIHLPNIMNKKILHYLPLEVHFDLKHEIMKNKCQGFGQDFRRDFLFSYNTPSNSKNQDIIKKCLDNTNGGIFERKSKVDAHNSLVSTQKSLVYKSEIQLKPDVNSVCLKDSCIVIVFIYEFENKAKVCRARKCSSDRDTVLAVLIDGIQCRDKTDGKKKANFLIKSRTGAREIYNHDCSKISSLIDTLIEEVMAKDDVIEVNILIGCKKPAIFEDKLYKRLPEPHSMLMFYVIHDRDNIKIEKYRQIAKEADALFLDIKLEYSKYHINRECTCELILPLEDDSIITSELEDIRNHIPRIMRNKVLPYLPVEVHIKPKFETFNENHQMKNECKILLQSENEMFNSKKNDVHPMKKTLDNKDLCNLSEINIKIDASDTSAQCEDYITILFIYQFESTSIASRAEKISYDRDTILAAIRAETGLIDEIDHENRFLLFRSRFENRRLEETSTSYTRFVNDITERNFITDFDIIVVRIPLNGKKLDMSEDKLYKHLPDPGRILVSLVCHDSNDIKIHKYEQVDRELSSLAEYITTEYQRCAKPSDKECKCKLVVPLEDEPLIADKTYELRNHLRNILRTKPILHYLPLEVHINFNKTATRDQISRKQVSINHEAYLTKKTFDDVDDALCEKKKDDDHDTSVCFKDITEKNDIQLDPNVNSICLKTSQDNNELTRRIIYNDSEDNDLEPNYVGLVNQAMTCYLNSLLQALYMTPEFRNALYNWEYRHTSDKDPTSDKDNSIPFQLQKLFLNLQTSSKRAVETTALTKSFGWDSTDSWHQHDIQELCRVMFDALEKNFKNTAQADLINELYQGKVNDYVKCLTCNTEKSRVDTFLDIALPVRSYDTSVTYSSVEEALEAFVKYELLEGNNQYFCEKCDKKSNAHKGLKFSKFPYILTIQLKRFDFDHSTFYRIKLNDKVTFPHILNLNSFIESDSEQNSTSCEKLSELNEKCNFGDRNTTSDESILFDSTSCNANHNSNHDDDDEGIGDMSNGLSCSSATSHRYNLEKMREKYAKSKGPYIYELFSIMIHSGSANGGHYYAYIKDFRTDKWLCFNDQNVKPITEDDIIKSYGGARGSNFSTSYRCSTNAYMLMYRQVDQKRNVLPMQADEFPPHIKTLLQKITDDRMNLSYNEKRASVFEKAVYYHHPITKNLESVKVLITMDCNLKELAKTVYSRAELENLVDFEQCRIVSYNLKYDIIEKNWTDLEAEFKDLDYISENRILPELALEIRGKDETFKNYLFPIIITKVYVLDEIKRDLLHGPKYIRAHGGENAMTIREYKQELYKHFKLDPEKLILLCRDLNFLGPMADDNMFSPSGTLLTFIACDSYDTSKDILRFFRSSLLYRMNDSLNVDLVTFFINSSSINEKNIEMAKVPSYEDSLQDNLQHVNNVNSNTYVTVGWMAPKNRRLRSQRHRKEETDVSSNDEHEKNETSIRSLDQIKNKVLKDNQPVQTDYQACNDEETWNQESQVENSNSEDSNEDSDKTLVGDIPDDYCDITEPEDYSSLSPVQVHDHHVLNTQCKNKSDVFDSSGAINEEYIRITPHTHPQMWKVSMNKRLKEYEVKEHLAPYLKVPTNYFRIVDCHGEDISSAIPSYHIRKFIEGREYTIELGRILLPNENKIEIYILDMNSHQPLKKSFSIILKKHNKFSLVKQQALFELKRTHGLDFSFNKIHFWALEDDKVTECQDICDSIPYQLCIQELPDENKISNLQLLIYVRKWNRSDLILEAPQELIVDQEGLTSNLIDKICSLSEQKILPEDLELALLPVKRFVTDNMEGLLWKKATSFSSDIAEIDLKTYLLYRDSKENPKIEDKSSSFPHLGTLSGGDMRHLVHLSSTSSCSPRREKALKIYVDST